MTSWPPQVPDWNTIEGEWLAAGKRQDVAHMRELQRQFPQRLALDRVFPEDDANRQQQPHQNAPLNPPRARVSDWSGFPLATLGDSAIHTAVWNRSVDVVRFLLESGQHPDARDDWQMTPLMATIMRHGLPLIRSVFVGRVAIPRHLAMDCRQETAELTATTLEIAQLLLQFGAYLDARSYVRLDPFDSCRLLELTQNAQDGKTALMLAAHDDAFEIAELLLNRGATIDAQDQGGWTALRQSVESRSLLTINMLLGRGADIDLPDSTGVSPLLAAIQHNRINQLQIFVNHFALVAQHTRLDFVGFVLLEAVAADAYEVVQCLLREGAFVNVNFRNELGESVFHHARSSRMVELLVEFDSDLAAFRSRTIRGESCFHYAARIPVGRCPHVLTSLLGLLGEANTLHEDFSLLGGNHERSTALYVAATHPDGSIESRAAKCSMLMAYNAPLFDPDEKIWHIQEGYESGSLVLSDPVQVFLGSWLTSSGDDEYSSDDSAGGEFAHNLFDLVTEWLQHLVASSRRLVQENIEQVPLSELILALVCAGYTIDVVPLLLQLPLELTGAERVVELLERFVARRTHDGMALLQRLVTDMADALHEVVETNR